MVEKVRSLGSVGDPVNPTDIANKRYVDQAGNTPTFPFLSSDYFGQTNIIGIVGTLFDKFVTVTTSASPRTPFFPYLTRMGKDLTISEFDITYSDETSGGVPVASEWSLWEAIPRGSVTSILAGVMQVGEYHLNFPVTRNLVAGNYYAWRFRSVSAAAWAEAFSLMQRYKINE